MPAVGIVDAADCLIGLVTSESIGEMLMVHPGAAGRRPGSARGV